VACLLLQACGVHYYDTQTGTEHVWGVGHMKMKAAPPNEGLKSVIRGTDLVGVGVGVRDRQPSLALGWDRQQRMEIVDSNATIRLEWPNADFVNVRVGSEFPQQPAPQAAPQPIPKTQEKP
jgi:hypothetical protein